MAVGSHPVFRQIPGRAGQEGFQTACFADDRSIRRRGCDNIAERAARFEFGIDTRKQLRTEQVYPLDPNSGKPRFEPFYNGTDPLRCRVVDNDRRLPGIPGRLVEGVHIGLASCASTGDVVAANSINAEIALRYFLSMLISMG
ncbi:hypothetical protein J2T08_005666 [Neorhizobium galegae]|nr:hypothetical protein [Neorhizobium galegae]